MVTQTIYDLFDVYFAGLIVVTETIYDLSDVYFAGVIVVTQTIYDLSEVYSQLMEIKCTLVEIDQSGRRSSPELPHHELVMRTSDSSSL